MVFRDDARLVPCDSHLWARQRMWSTATIEIYPYKGPCLCKTEWLLYPHCGYHKFTMMSETDCIRHLLDSWPTDNPVFVEA